jgi:hypothetical protein
MLNSDLQKRLSLLDYTIEWINAGVLTEATLESQLQELATGVDTNKEHYRYRTLTVFLNSHSYLNDTQVDQIIGLLQVDPDEAMAGSVLISLLKRKSLTQTQFNSISKALTSFGGWTERHILIQRDAREKEGNSGK